MKINKNYAPGEGSHIVIKETNVLILLVDTDLKRFILFKFIGTI